MSYEEKLLALRKTIQKKPDQSEKEVKEKRMIPPSPSYEQKWLKAGLIKEENEFGVVYKRLVHYDEGYQHGATKLSHLDKALKKWREIERPHPLAPKENRTIVFFDTETTGLKGAGTLIFLIGFLKQIHDGFLLTQYLLPAPDHEAAFLYASKLWEEKLTLVTYNGKSFDLPQIEMRWTMHRKELPNLLSHHQIDLLHGSRRLWKTELEQFNLTTIERKRLGFYREGDIPGHLAPIIYQDAVKSGRIESLFKVLQHNEWDILSLVTLYIQTTHLLFTEKQPVTAHNHMNIGKWFADLKMFDKSGPFFERVIQKYGVDHPLTYYHYGFFLKRKKLYESALESFQVAASQLNGLEKVIALEEIAKLYEHRMKDYQQALKVTNKARSYIHHASNLTKPFKNRAETDFVKREERLQRKIEQEQ